MPPRDFFGISDDPSDDDSAMDQFSLPRGVRAKRKAPVKALARRPSVRRGSVKRGSARRVSKRKTSRPAQPQRLTAAEVRQVPIPRPAQPPKPLVALFEGHAAAWKGVSIEQVEKRLSQLRGEVVKAPVASSDLGTVQGWVELLRLVPRTIERLGIAGAVRDGSFADRKLGSGLYAMVFELPDPLLVLKLTRDPEDAYIAKLVVDEGGDVRGLARTNSIFRIELPFEVPAHQPLRKGVPVGQVNAIYGMVVERAVSIPPGEGRDILLQKAMQDRRIDLPDAATLLRRAYGEANQILERAEEAYDRKENYFGKFYNPERPGDNQTERDFRAGTAWCAARGLRFDADAHCGNFGLVWRGDRFACVKIDLGHRSVERGREYAISETERLPLAANRHWSK